MVGSAIVGGVLLAMIEGVGILFNRMTSEQFKPGKGRCRTNKTEANRLMSFSIAANGRSATAIRKSDERRVRRSAVSMSCDLLISSVSHFVQALAST